jgi:hypothetical protein
MTIPACKKDLGRDSHANRPAGRPANRWEGVDVGKVYAALDDDLRAFIKRQHVFFVATASMSPDGHVNVSPKGLNTLRILGPTSIAYLDLTGSGVETVAHLRENGRITIMVCAFADSPRILRL